MQKREFVVIRHSYNFDIILFSKMNNGSCTVDIHEGVEKLDPNISQPDSWAENSHQNILDSQGIFTMISTEYKYSWLLLFSFTR